MMPMTARGYATEIMVRLEEAGVDIPLVRTDGGTIQDLLTDIMETAMAQVERGEEWRDVIYD